MIIESPKPRAAFPLLPAVFLISAIFACSIYANLSFAITDKDDFRYLPPFKPNQNLNQNRHLGGEYYMMAQSLLAGEGFSHPFDKPTGPTAWQPPLLPSILAVFLWIGGDRDGVMAIVIFCQVFILIGTGLLIVALVRQSAGKIGSFVAAVLYFLGLLCNFHLWFQWTHDSWLVLLALDLLIAGLCWLQPLHRWPRAVGWGLFGGLCALLSPIVGFTWGLMSLLTGFRQRAWPQLGMAVLVAGLLVLPWTVRNYLVLGSLIPLKSNLAYELYQTQNLQKDGLLQGKTFALHPYHANTRERQEYNQVGEVAYLEHKRAQFWESVRAAPLDFVERIERRFVGATLWYEPFWPDEAKRTTVLGFSRLTHPLPFLALLFLIVTAIWKPLHDFQGIVMGVYALYLLPYIGVSYYERYAVPLVGVKVLLVIWAADRLLSLILRKARTRSSSGPVYVSRGQPAFQSLPLPRET